MTTTPTQAPGWRKDLEELRDDLAKWLLQDDPDPGPLVNVTAPATISTALAELDRLSAALAEAEGALEPFVKAFKAAEERYRRRGGDPDAMADSVPWFEAKKSLLIGGKPAVPSEIVPLTLGGPYRRAASALATLQRARGDQP